MSVYKLELRRKIKIDTDTYQYETIGYLFYNHIEDVKANIPYWNNINIDVRVTQGDKEIEFNES